MRLETSVKRARVPGMWAAALVLAWSGHAGAQPGLAPEQQNPPSEEGAAESAPPDDDAELAALRAAADQEIGPTESAPAPGPEQGFRSGARALQAFNPEISVIADVVANGYLNDDGYLVGDEGVQRSGLLFRVFELAFQSNLDPYSFAKFIFSYEDGHAGLEEGYVSWVGLIPRLAITVGRFKQQLGVINRWHLHAFDQVDRPLVHTKYLGEEGLAGTGVSLRFIIPPVWAHAQELTLEVTNGENQALFAGEFFSIPSVLGHLKNYWDLDPATYLELGVTGLWGLNNKRGYVDETSGLVFDEPRRQTVLGAADLTISWLPPGRAKYRGVTSRSEVLYLRKQVDDGSGGRATGDALGGYTYLDVRTGPRTFVGARFDIGQNFAVDDHSWFWQASPYLTFWQSEFVFFRLQYDATRESEGQLAHKVMLQIDWAAGPHKHDKY